MQDSPSPTEISDKFRRKRNQILDAAAREINRRGLKGLTLVEVARAVGLNTPSVTYYFRRKDLLAEAAMERSIERWGALVARAEAEPDPRRAVRALIHAYLGLSAGLRRGQEPPLALLSELRALNRDSRARLMTGYEGLLRRVAALFGPAPDRSARAGQLARAYVLLDNLHWSRTWLPYYSVSDFPRVETQLMHLYDGGLAVAGAAWAPRPLPAAPDSDPDSNPDSNPGLTPEAAPAPGGETSRETYLRAATLEINERGYRGASVERIAARLNLSKGSFYHHLSGKDDLVLACFDRSYARVSAVQKSAMAGPGRGWDRLCSAAETLISVQFDARFPLLRTTALQVLPEDLRPGIIRRSNRMAQRFAGMMIDGIIDGSIRPVDPLIASQCLMAAINAGFDFRHWAARRPDPETARALYAAPLFFGLFDRT